MGGDSCFRRVMGEHDWILDNRNYPRMPPSPSRFFICPFLLPSLIACVSNEKEGRDRVNRVSRPEPSDLRADSIWSFVKEILSARKNRLAQSL
jgi:hypothetical protein